jgi:hypothetical protein
MKQNLSKAAVKTRSSVDTAPEEKKKRNRKVAYQTPSKSESEKEKMFTETNSRQTGGEKGD